MAAPDERALNYAWAWFALHAGQRMQLVNFFLLSIAFVVAGYGATLGNGFHVAAGGIAIVGALIAVGFWGLEVRTRELVRAAEAPLRILEQRLADQVGVAHLDLVHRAHEPQRPMTSYSRVILFLVWLSIVALVVAAIYAFWFAPEPPQRHGSPGRHGTRSVAYRDR
jgi:uncharacterized ion transporter superfamily protein YfcC